MAKYYNDSQKKAHYKYAAEKLKRVPLDMQLSDYEIVKQHAAAAGESVNGYIKAAIKKRIDAEKRKEKKEVKQKT